jgi:TetR/AcrR family transcriptional regulator, transcriptional repressor for nem operon
VLRTARDLVHRTSLAEVSIDDICTEAGVHRGSLYHFFPSKDALGLAVLDANWDLMRAMLDESFQDAIEPLDRIDRFIQGFRRMLALMRQQMGTTPGCPLGGLTAELSAQPGSARDRAQAVLGEWSRYFSDAVHEAQVRGQVPSSIDPHAAALRILAYVQGMALLARVYDRPDQVVSTRGTIRALIAAD